MRPDRVTRVAVVGGGPAGIYAADLLVKEHEQVVVDVIERLPAPYGLVRYGVAPDHPRIKEIINALRRVLAHDRVRFLGNVDYGTDLKLDDLRRHYDAVVVATGAMTDRPMDLPGQDLDGSYGAADFVSWYAGHPDVPREWPLDATEVAVLGAGNVGLDVARMLAKPVAEQMTTEIPANVEAGLAANQAKVVHVFARRGPAHAKFSPMELRELSHSPSVDVVVEEEGFEIDDAGQAVIGSVKSQRMVVDTLLRYVETPPTGAPHRIEIHLMQDPVEIVGEDGRVTAIRTAHTEYDGTGRVTRTDDVRETPVQAVYRAVGYRSSALPDVPFDEADGVVPNDGGRVLDLLAALVGSLRIDGARVAQNIRRSCITITELADTLVRGEGLSFREAHEIAAATARAESLLEQALRPPGKGHMFSAIDGYDHVRSTRAAAETKIKAPNRIPHVVRANLLDELYACTSWTSVPHFGKAGRRSPPTGATERERGTLPLVNKTKLSTVSKIRVFACLREQP